MKTFNEKFETKYALVNYAKNTNVRFLKSLVAKTLNEMGWEYGYKASIYYDERYTALTVRIKNRDTYRSNTINLIQGKVYTR